MPSVTFSSIATATTTVVDITAFGTYFNNALLWIAFIVVVGVMVIKVAYTKIIKGGVKGAVRAIGVGGGRGRRRR